MNVRYRVELNQAERCELTAMLRGGKRAARKWSMDVYTKMSAPAMTRQKNL
jgi:hypothetical protein